MDTERAQMLADIDDLKKRVKKLEAASDDDKPKAKK